MWPGKNTYWLNQRHGRDIPLNTTTVRRAVTYEPTPYYGGECRGVYYHRLLRDGWTLISRQPIGKLQHTDIFEIKIGKSWVLRKIAHAEIGTPLCIMAAPCSGTAFCDCDPGCDSEARCHWRRQLR